MKSGLVLLFPFAIIYDGITSLRNRLYDWGFFKTETPKLRSIGVGNLRVGGTGKSVLVDYLCDLLKEEYRVVVLSRGYKRTTKGVQIASENSTAQILGDEPFQFFSKHEIAVLVSENRSKGLQALKKIKPFPDLIVFDDLMQHRRVKPHCMVLTTTYDQPYYDDHLLPWGRLRESKKGARRAQIIIVTKCPPKITLEEQKQIKERINPSPAQALFFSKIVYDEQLYNRSSTKRLEAVTQPFILITGIDNPLPLVHFLEDKKMDFTHLEYSNHHQFTEDEVVHIKNIKQGRLLVTTEKDFGRLLPYFSTEELFYLPIKMEFIGEGVSEQFSVLVKKEINVS